VTAAGAAAEPLVDEIRIRIERSYQAGDLANIEGARRELLQLATAPDSPDPASLAYFAAYGRFRQAMASAGEPATARRFLEDCITELTAVVRRAPGHAEARALLGSCHGMSTVYSPLATMTRGPEARRQLNEARRLAPDNPWVVMQDGLADWATPRLFGGNREVAVEKLERAARLFASAVDAGSRLAAWGAAETWRQLAPRYRELGRETEARLALDRANGDMPHFAAPRQVALQN
jgi:tetratricopeptide (TPR) repeat protein